MTNTRLKDDLQMSLDALELAHPGVGIATHKHVEAIEALRTRLANWPEDGIGWALFRPNGTLQYLTHCRDLNLSTAWHPVYLHPAEPTKGQLHDEYRKGFIDGQIDMRGNDMDYEDTQPYKLGLIYQQLADMLMNPNTDMRHLAEFGAKMGCKFSIEVVADADSPLNGNTGD
jgi:hypothetical protein